MGAATALATTHLPHAGDAALVYKNTEPGIWSRQGSIYVHGEEKCHAGTPRSPARTRLVPACLALAWQRRACRTCLPDGIQSAIDACTLPPMPCGVTA